MERISGWKKWNLLRQGREADDVVSSTVGVFRVANTTSRVIPKAWINYLGPGTGKGREITLTACLACTSPLKDWTKLLKQFRTIKLGNYEKREKVFQSRRSAGHSAGRSA